MTLKPEHIVEELNRTPKLKRDLIMKMILPFVFHFVDRPGGAPGEWDRVAFRGAARQGVRH